MLGGGGSNGTVLNDFRSDQSLLDDDLLTESLDRVLSLQLLKLDGSVLIEELIDRKISSTNSKLDMVLFNLGGDSLGTKSVDTLGLSHEHDLELGSLGVVVDVLSKLPVDRITLDWDVNGNSLLEIDDVLL